ncbi:18.1 kDa class I heat shock protein [Camellia lanceoleosa]|uniref:18.1 kDa class I heat shock protein n=1 Tax=Camellia lanceoleosa TaxID=1840588 RepID=A0ACC0H4Z5_9ERIC|nr:18.1 kDa class I heat shock protein [Camellia lanceoleosa]
MALIPSIFGRQGSNIFDPFSFNIWDLISEGSRIAARDTTAEVKVEVEEDGIVLQISEERSQEEEEKTDTWHYVEHVKGKFMRRFRLPKNVKMDEIKASMENGVLTVVIPKEQEKKPKVKTIDISG